MRYRHAWIGWYVDVYTCKGGTVDSVDNDLDPEGADVIAKMLTTSKLKSLYIGGMFCLFDFVFYDFAEFTFIDGNYFDEEDCEVIANALTQSKHIRELHMDSMFDLWIRLGTPQHSWC